MHVCSSGIDCVSFYDFSIGFCNFSDSAVFFVFHFILISKYRDYRTFGEGGGVWGKPGQTQLTYHQKSKHSVVDNADWKHQH